MLFILLDSGGVGDAKASVSVVLSLEIVVVGEDGGEVGVVVVAAASGDVVLGGGRGGFAGFGISIRIILIQIVVGVLSRQRLP